jgi:hypothetical protein
LEIIRGSHGNPLLLVKFKNASNFIIKDTDDIEALTWIPTLDEVKIISDTLFLLNNMIEYIKRTDRVRLSSDFEIGHD